MREHHKGKSLFQLIDKKGFNALVDEWGIDKEVLSTPMLLAPGVPSDYSQQKELPSY